MRPTARIFLSLLALFVLSPSNALATTSTPVTAGADTEVTATLDGEPMDPIEASHFYCHTRDYPIVRCFRDPDDLFADMGLGEPDESPTQGQVESQATTLSVPYGIAYSDTNYGGSFLVLYIDIANLAPYGWSDIISSVKSVNCGLPAFYVNTSYSGSFWENTCNTGSPNLYGYNDTFSSVKDLN